MIGSGPQPSCPVVFKRRSLSVAFLMLLVACGNAGGEGEGKGRAQPPPLVKAEPASTMRFVDAIEAVGTARANE